jgi:broad specificity phosphatase PhoE
MTAKRIWLVRHGQSQSQTGESHDHLNPLLSDLGIVQSGRLVKPLCDPDRFVTLLE